MVSDLVCSSPRPRWNYIPGQPYRTHQVDCDEAIPHFRRVFEKGLYLVPAGAIDQAIDPLGPLMACGRENLDGWCIGEIERQGLDSKSLCSTLRHGRAPACL